MFSRRNSAASGKAATAEQGRARAAEADARPSDSRPGNGAGKGRPTPKRREAEQARREAIKPKRGGARQMARAARDQSVSERTARAEGIKRGDERYLPERDKGPVRTLARDVVDSRLTVAEFFLPTAVIVLVCTFTGNKGLVTFATNLWAVMVVAIGVDLFVLTRRIRKLVAQRHPDAPRRGLAPYAMMRSLTFRKMRTPPPRVERGAKP